MDSPAQKQLQRWGWKGDDRWTCTRSAWQGRWVGGGGYDVGVGSRLTILYSSHNVSKRRKAEMGSIIHKGEHSCLRSPWQKATWLQKTTTTLCRKREPSANINKEKSNQLQQSLAIVVVFFTQDHFCPEYWKTPGEYTGELANHPPTPPSLSLPPILPLPAGSAIWNLFTLHALAAVDYSPPTAS